MNLKCLNGSVYLRPAAPADLPLDVSFDYPTLSSRRPMWCEIAATGTGRVDLDGVLVPSLADLMGPQEAQVIAVLEYAQLWQQGYFLDDWDVLAYAYGAEIRPNWGRCVVLPDAVPKTAGMILLPDHEPEGKTWTGMVLSEAPDLLEKSKKEGAANKRITVSYKGKRSHNLVGQRVTYSRFATWKVHEPSGREVTIVNSRDVLAREV